MLYKNWIIKTPDKELISGIAKELSIDPFLCLLLSSRGITSKEEIKKFFSKEELSDPFSFKDIDKAVKRIKLAIKNFEKICVYGDYDADGITATALLYSHLVKLSANVRYFIPDRYKHGYGLNKDAIEELYRDGVKLIVTVDNGIVAFDEVNFANSKNIDVVITDHHQASESLPNAIAVVNPHRLDSDMQFKDFSGVGVAFKLAAALSNSKNQNELLEDYADLIAIGTIGDVVPLIFENRILVQKGLSLIKSQKRLSLATLINHFDFKKDDINSTFIAFSIVPRLNACGRLKSAEIATKFLLASTLEDAQLFSSEIDCLNTERKQIEIDIFNKVEEFLKNNPSRLLNHIIIAEGENFHPGVIGIVASRLVDKYSKPCIVISKKDGIARGSGRSVDGFSLFDATNFCSHYMLKFGGHKMAVGFDIESDKIETLIKDINEFVDKSTREMPVSKIVLDCKLNPTSISLNLVNQIENLEPFGCQNPSPCFGIFGVTIEKITPLSGGKHIKLFLSRDDATFSAIKFNENFSNFSFLPGDTIDLAVTLKKDFFQGIESVSIFIKDIKFSNLSQDYIIKESRLYEKIRRGEEIAPHVASYMIPQREEIANIYRFLAKNNGWSYSLASMFYRLNSTQIGICKLEIILDIMAELSLINLQKFPHRFIISINNVDEKVDLNSSAILKNLKFFSHERM